MKQEEQIQEQPHANQIVPEAVANDLQLYFFIWIGEQYQAFDRIVLNTRYLVKQDRPPSRRER
jgi:hypothetical protein